MVELGPRWIFPPRLDYGEIIIKVVVGSGHEQKTFAVHKNLLCAVSEYFEGKLNCPSFTESQEMTVTLKDDTPSTFEVLQRWVYSGKVDDAGSYTGDDTLQEDQFWLRVYQLADYLQVRAVQVIAFERFETVFPCTKPIILPSKDFLKDLYKAKASTKALQVYVASHTAYWMLRVSKKAEKWTELLECQPRYGQDTATVLAKLLPLQFLHPERFPRAHPAHRRGSFAADCGLDLEYLRAEANLRITVADYNATARPVLGMFPSSMHENHTDFESDIIADSQLPQSDEEMPLSTKSSRRQSEEFSTEAFAGDRPSKRIRVSLLGAAATLDTHTEKEASLSFCMT